MPSPPAGPAGVRERRVLELLRWLAPLAALPVLAAVGFVLHRELARRHPADILAQLRRIPSARVLMAVALSALSYGLISGYDLLALRYVRKPLHYGRVLFTAFIAAVFGHNLGF